MKRRPAPAVEAAAAEGRVDTEIASGPLSDYEFTLSLRIRHPDMDPALITRALGQQPQHSWRAGDARKDAEGDVLEGKYRESYWMCGLMPHPKLATESIGVESELLQVLTSLQNSFSFLQALHSSGGASEVHVSIFASQAFRIELLAEMVSRLGRIGIGMTLEVEPRSMPLPMGTVD